MKMIFALFLIGILNIFSSVQAQSEQPNFAAFSRFYRKLAGYVRGGEINLTKNYQIRIKSEFANGKISDGKLTLSINENKPEMLEVLGDFLKGVDDSKLFQIIALKELNESIKTAEIDINFEDENANFVFRFQTDSAKSAEKIAIRFKMLFVMANALIKDQPAVEFYKNAKFEVEKENLFFSTKVSKQNLALYLRDW
jgi:hypothetical protein